LADSTRITRKTSAREGIQSICASSTIEARVGFTFIDLGLAEVARITRETGAGEAGETISTSGTVLAWIGSAIVDVGLT
jgi:hypothetical protein